MTWIAYVLAAAVLIAAGVVVYRGVRDFIRTKGMSACRRCPYSGQCGARDRDEACRRGR